MTVSEIVIAIQAVDTDVDLRVINRALREQFVHLGRVATLQFRPGQRVKFNGRNRQRLEGTVEKINRTSVTVNVGNNLKWRVAPGLLERVA